MPVSDVLVVGARSRHVARGRDGAAPPAGRRFHATRIGAGTRIDTATLERALRATGAPFFMVDVDEPGLRAVYERDLLLRPDLQVVWRGDETPVDPERIAAVVTERVTHQSREETNNVETADA